jgi:hypothetical protein
MNGLRAVCFGAVDGGNGGTGEAEDEDACLPLLLTAILAQSGSRGSLFLACLCVFTSCKASWSACRCDLFCPRRVPVWFVSEASLFGTEPSSGAARRFCRKVNVLVPYVKVTSVLYYAKSRSRMQCAVQGKGVWCWFQGIIILQDHPTSNVS